MLWQRLLEGPTPAAAAAANSTMTPAAALLQRATLKPEPSYHI